MVQIKIKTIKNTYHVYAQFDDASAFLQQLPERLKFCHRENGQYFEAFFHLPRLTANDLEEVFHICEQYQVIITGFDIFEKDKRPFFHEKELVAHETYEFKEPKLILGNIPAGTLIISSESIYVLGSMNGSVDLLHEDCVLYASQIQGNVRICDTSFQNMTISAPCKVYDNHSSLHVLKYKEERVWERQLQSHLEKAV